MTAFNVVRVRVKPGREEEFLELHRNTNLDAEGLRGGVLIKTGERAYCLIAEWDSMDRLAAARPAMAAELAKFRDMLEDLGGGLGISDPVSGKAIIDRRPMNQPS